MFSLIFNIMRIFVGQLSFPYEERHPSEALFTWNYFES